MTPAEALQCNINVAQRELDSRAAQGEDVSHLRVCQETAAIVCRWRVTVEHKLQTSTAYVLAHNSIEAGNKAAALFPDRYAVATDASIAEDPNGPIDTAPPSAARVLILNRAQAEAVYSAMCALNNVSARLRTSIPGGIVVSENDDGRVYVLSELASEVFGTQGSFATAYGLKAGA